MKKTRFSGKINKFLPGKKFIDQSISLVKKDLSYKVVQKARKKQFPALKQLRHMGKILSRGEKKTLQFSVFLFFIGVLWGALVFTSQYRTKVPAVGGTYTEAVVGSVEAINPLFSTVSITDQDLVKLIYSGLMKYDKNQDLQTDLAESYTLSEDKTVYTFVLRENIFWHDGQPFSTNDIVYTFNQIQDPKAKSPLSISFEGVEVRAIDEKTVEFRLPDPFPAFLDSLTVGILPQHIWENIPPEQLSLAKPNLRPVGTGPYQFSRLARDDRGFIFQYELKRFEQYYDQPAYIEEFVFQFFGEYDTDAGAITALRQTKVDGLHFVPTDLKDRVERKNIVIHTLQLPQYTGLFFNQKKNTILEEKEVRQALAIALDKDRILRESLDGEGRVIYSPILPGYPGFDENLEKTPYSIQQANELLDNHLTRLSANEFREQRRAILIEQAGINLDSASTSTNSVSSTDQQLIQSIDARLDADLSAAQLFYRQNDDEETFSLRIVTADTPEYRQAAELIAGFWQDVGILSTVEYVRPQDMTVEVLKDRDYDVLLYGVLIGSDPDQYPFWHSSQVEHPGLNLSQYVNRSIDEKLETVRESSDPEEVQRLYTEFQQTILEDQPAVFLYTPIYRYATTNRLQGFDISRIFSPADRFSNATEWFVRTKGKWSLQKSE